MKIILGIIAFTLTFGLSSTLVGLIFGFPKAETAVYQTSHNSSAKYKIRNVLRRDERYGKIRDRKVRRALSTNDVYLFRSIESKATKSYYRRASSINDSNLPRDFQYAWRNHMNAWKKQAQYREAIVNSEGYNPNGLSDNSYEINSTFDQVLRIAERYGVEIVGTNYY